MLDIKIRNKNILVIGNNLSILDNEFEESYLKKFFVVRFNEFETIGYEKNIGSKTDLWIINGNADVHNRLLEETTRENIKNIFIISNEKQRAHGTVKLLKQKYKDVKLIHKVQKQPWNDIYPVVTASTGLVGILNIAKKYSNKSIYTLGFNYIVPKDAQIIGLRNENYMGTECKICNHRQDAEEDRSKWLMEAFGVKHLLNKSD